MLIMFRVKNFASFKNEIVLDLRAVAFKDMKNHVVENQSVKIVKTLAIFGKNASGKSNLISALYFFESFVYNQFFDSGERDDEIDRNGRMPSVRRTVFRLSEKINTDSEFEILFLHDDKIFQYGFVISETQERNEYTIREEWLLVDDKLVFDRQQDEISFGKKYVNELKKINKQRPDRLYLGVLDYFAEGNVKVIVDEFKEYLQHNFNVHFELIFEGSVKGLISRVSFSDRIVKDEEYRKTIEKFLTVADVGIKGICVEENKDEKTKDKNPYKVKTIHNIYDDDGVVTGQAAFDFNLESSGTNRYFSFIQYVLNMIEKGGVFIVDELSARLHPVLTKFIVDLFQAETNKKAQLIFTTHDISLMNRKQFRRDEIAFVDKNDQGESSVYTLADIKVRSDASFAKDYLAGKYGAIPVLLQNDLYKELEGDWLRQD